MTSSLSEPSVLLRLSLVELAKAIRERKVTSETVVQTYLNQIAAYNGKLHAIVTLNPDALSRAKEADAAMAAGQPLWGPLHGVPVSIKDAWQTKGIKTTCNTKPLEKYVPTENAWVVELLVRAGAVILGKENLPEMAGDAQVIGPLWPVTNNPYDLKRTPGGSTGGGAAAVAACLSPLSIGSSIGGSVEMPASWTGLFGFKPSEGLCSMVGHVPPLPTPSGYEKRVPMEMPSPGWLARSLEDIVCVTELLAGKPAPVDPKVRLPLSVPQPVNQKKPGDYKVGWTIKGKVTLEGQVQTAVLQAIEKLRTKGFQMTEVTLPFVEQHDQWAKLWAEIFVSGTQLIGSSSFGFRSFLKALPYLAPGDPVHVGMAAGAWANLQTYGVALAERARFQALMHEALASYDVVLLPVTASVAMLHNPKRSSVSVVDASGVKRDNGYFMNCIAFTCMCNLAGIPMLSIPLGLNNEGLPLSLGVIARRFEDLNLLRAASSIRDALGATWVPPSGFGVDQRA